jgi:hypothetical protein
MAVLGLILNFLGGAVLIYYGDKTGSFPDRFSNNVKLSRWVFYSGVGLFCIGYFLVLVSMIF